MGYGRKYRTLHKIASYFFSNYFTRQIMDEMVAYRARLSSKKVRSKFKGKKELKVNIGCGASGKPGWCNVDVMSSVEVNCIWDCRRSLPFDDNSAKCIFTEHFIEHIDYYEDAPLLFKDIYRILKPGGVVRIIVPDAHKYLEAYNQKGWENIAKIRPLLKGNVDSYTNKIMNTKMELVNWIFRQEYQHKFAYDFETLKFQLSKVGFKTILKQDFNLSLNNELLLDIPSRASESLYVEAIKE